MRAYVGMVKKIISHELKGDSLQKYVQFQATILIKLEDRLAFLEDLQEDINELSPQTSAGLGISLGS